MTQRRSDAEVAERALRARFHAAGDAEDAGWQKAYMKSRLSFHGVSSREVREAAKEVLAARPGIDHDALVALVDGLFQSDWFDVRSAGLVILDRKTRSLESTDLPWLIELVRRGACWAHVDLLATHLVGGLVAKDPTTRRHLPKWAKDADFWVRRTALLAQERELKRGRGDFALFERIAVPMLGEREFFIRKAIGWVLRETSKLRPELSYAFLVQHRDRVSGLTLREGARHLPPAMRASLALGPATPRRPPATKRVSRD